MLNSARKTMPAIDYVSIIRSVYGDRRAMLAGAFASAFAASLCAYNAQSPALWVVATVFIVFGFARYFNMRAFWRADVAADDAEAAEHWEHRAVILGALVAVLYGTWCLVSMTLVNNPYAELVSVSISIAVMVGICARNFGLDRLVAIQMLLVIVPLSLGLLLKGDWYHPVLAVLLLVMLSSFRKLAGDIRSILLSAVHGRAEASRLAAELDTAMSTLEHGLVMLDDKGVIAVANERATRVFAVLGLQELVGQSFEEALIQLADIGALPRTALERLIDMVKRQAAGKVLLFLSGERSFEVTVSSRHERTVLLFEDVSERVAAEERINFMARHDTLTGLPNRTYFGELVSQDLTTRQADPAPVRTVSLMIIDIDDFKHVNDTFGHIVGDELLVQVAQRLRKALPAEATLARLGGDEFVIYRGMVGDVAGAEADAKTVLAAFAAPFRLQELTLTVNVSVGLVTSHLSQDLLEDLMTKADLALYSAKGDGKAKSQVFHAQMDIDYHYRQRLKNDLRAAIAEGALSLAFQPLLDIKTRKIVSCEALARWNHPELGFIPPSTFIPLAEEMGLISEITGWVLEQAIAQCSTWPGEVSVAVNISARDFRGADLEALVDHALDKVGLAPSRLEIEVTETAVIEEPEIAKTVLAALGAKGIIIALDDFGTGYSSLSYLNALPFKKLKIDRAFVSDITLSPRALSLVTNVARLGRDLDLTVVAEGIETQAQLELLVARTEVQQVQGYLFSRPVGACDMQQLIGRFNDTATTSQTDRRHG